MIELIKELRTRTNAPMGECKSALTEAGNNIEEAIVVLKKRGLISAAKKAEREAKAGKIVSYIHNGKIAVLVEVNCETDFVASNEMFQEFCDNVAMQVAAMNPQFLNFETVDPNCLVKQKEVFAAQVPASVPESRVQNVLDGKLKKWMTEVCLMNQKPVADEKAKDVEQLRTDLVMKLGENIVVRRFVRWELNQ
jgi:elongation factor Ts